MTKKIDDNNYLPPDLLHFHEVEKKRLATKKKSEYDIKVHVIDLWRKIVIIPKKTDEIEAYTVRNKAIIVIWIFI
jgi:hypothetical protein